MTTTQSPTDQQPGAAFTVVGQSIVWKCARCGRPIRPGAGYLAVSADQANAHKRAVAEFHAEHPGGYLLSERERANIPPRARWGAWHSRCGPASSDNDFWIAVERANTFPRLLHWTVLLAKKPWINGTNWSGLMRKVEEDSRVTNKATQDTITHSCEVCQPTKRAADEFRCPRCKADPGEPCVRPNGSPVMTRPLPWWADQYLSPEQAHRPPDPAFHAPRMDAAYRDYHRRLGRAPLSAEKCPNNAGAS